MAVSSAQPGCATLLAVAALGPRKHTTTPPHNPGMVMIGAGMLWVGWFGFNRGSSLAANGQAAMAITVTHLSAAAASLSWAAWERYKFGRASLIGLVTGTIAGLASITPASGYVGPVAAPFIGGSADKASRPHRRHARCLRRAWRWRHLWHHHGGGAGRGGMATQLGGLAVVGLWTTIASRALIKPCAALLPIRVDLESEVNGLDLSTHDKRAYDITS